MTWLNLYYERIDRKDIAEDGRSTTVKEFVVNTYHESEQDRPYSPTRLCRDTAKEKRFNTADQIATYLATQIKGDDAHDGATLIQSRGGEIRGMPTLSVNKSGREKFVRVEGVGSDDHDLLKVQKSLIEILNQATS